MSVITLQEAQTWAEGTKLTLSNLETGLVDQIATQVFSRVAQAYDTTGWTNATNTPSLVRSVVAMLYVSWLYSKTYSEDETGDSWYANRLAIMAEALIVGIIDGTVDIIDVITPTLQGTSPSYYPTDASSALEPTADDPSLGGARFTMGVIF